METGEGRNRLALMFMGSFSSIMILLAISGVYFGYSPVPMHDMWHGYAEFYLRVSQGDWAAWWDQHNEHRLVLSRLLFWADLHWVEGRSTFLFLVNFLLLLLTAGLFSRIARQRIGNTPATNVSAAFTLFLVGWLVLWVQQQNLTWGFQSQFILAQLLPLTALYCLYLSSRLDRYFALACLLGVASAGTMANGVLALPLMAVHALLMGRKGQLAILLILSVVVPGLYFQGYSAPTDHASLLSTLLDDPSGVAGYVLVYLGMPFFHVARYAGLPGEVAPLAGLLLIAASVAAAVHLLLRIRSGQRDRQNALVLALLLFILYVGGSALAAAGTRLVFGLEQAVSSRYGTPVLMAWAALLLVYQRRVFSIWRKRRILVTVPVVVFCGLMLYYQSSALTDRQEELTQRRLAALSLALGVRDPVQVSHVINGEPGSLYRIASEMVDRELSVFGIYPFRGVRDRVGQVVDKEYGSAQSCTGGIDDISSVETAENHVRVHGWLRNPGTQKVPALLLVADQQGVIRGAGLAEHDSGAGDRGTNGRLGFLAYVRTSPGAGQRLQIFAEKRRGEVMCRANIVVSGGASAAAGEV